MLCTCCVTFLRKCLFDVRCVIKATYLSDDQHVVTCCSISAKCPGYFPVDQLHETGDISCWCFTRQQRSVANRTVQVTQTGSRRRWARLRFATTTANCLLFSRGLAVVVVVSFVFTSPPVGAGITCGWGCCCCGHLPQRLFVTFGVWSVGTPRLYLCSS